MQEVDPLYDYVTTFMLELMTVLYINGQKTANVGALMRLIGVPSDTAAKYDNELLDIDENFVELLDGVNIQYLLDAHSLPAGVTIH